MSLSEIVGSAGLAAYAEAALLLFCVAFGIVAFQIASRRSGATFEQQRMLPLEDTDGLHSSTALETPEALRNGR